MLKQAIRCGNITTDQDYCLNTSRCELIHLAFVQTTQAEGLESPGWDGLLGLAGSCWDRMGLAGSDWDGLLGLARSDWNGLDRGRSCWDGMDLAGSGLVDVG